MERSRSYSSGWNTRPTPPRIATVKPVSKSLSEDDLLKVSEISPRVFSRLKVQDLSLLKKDSLIDELEKCLEELEEEHGTTQQLGDIYEKVELERNQLLEELDIAFEDLKDYMQRQKDIEDQKTVVENDREELIKENEYLKAVLSSRNEIKATKLEEKNKLLEERVQELENKNIQLVDEINELYDDRQTLIGSLVNLRSEQVDEVIKKRSRSSSVVSRESLDDRISLDNSNLAMKLKELEDHDLVERAMRRMNGDVTDNVTASETPEGFHEEMREANKEIDRLKEEYEKLEKDYAGKIKEFNNLLEDRNEKNLSLSRLNLEKRTLQRQLDHMRESNRSSAGKVALLTDENKSLKGKCEEQDLIIQNNQKLLERSIQEAISEFEEELSSKQASYEQLLADKKLLDGRLESSRKSLEKNDSLIINNKKLTSDFTSLNSELQEITTKYEELTTKNTELTTQCSSLKSDCSKFRNENIQFRDTIDSLNKEKETLTHENSKLKLDYGVIEKQMNNRVNTLELEVTRLTAGKGLIEKILHKKEESEKTLRQTYEKLQQTIKSNEEELTSSQNPQSNAEEAPSSSQRIAETLRKENDRLLNKCRQLERSVADMSESVSESKRLKDTNEMLLYRVRNLQNGTDVAVKSLDQKTSEREKYSALLVKYDNLCNKYNNLCEQNKDSGNAFEKLEKENSELKEKNASLECKIFDFNNKLETNKNEEVKKLESENQALKTNVESWHEKFLTLKNDKTKVEERLYEISKGFQDLKENKENVEKDYQYILKSHKEEAQAELANKQNRVGQERDAIKTKYDLLRVEHDKCDKEKDHYKTTIDSLREENNKLNGEVQKYRLMSNSTQDLKIQQLRDENDSLERKLENLQNTVNKMTTEKKALVVRINRSDESVATTIRSLKARKNELQLQVETLKHDNEELRLNLKAKTNHEVTRTFSSPNVSFGYNPMEDNMIESLHIVHSKLTELEQENTEYSRKLQESEGLMYELQQALAHANDLAMQKALEGTKIRRNLEKKIEKLTTDNTELRRKLYFSDKESGEVSPNSLFPQSPILNKKLSEQELLLQRKASLPVDITSSKSTELPTSLMNCSNIFNYQDSQLSLSQDSSRTNSVPESPRLSASRQMENDLSKQLRDLLDFTKDLPSLEEEVVIKSRPVSEESIAPPIPPLPANYGGIKELSAKDSENIDEILASLSKVASELEDDDNKTKKLEHWV